MMDSSRWSVYEVNISWKLIEHCKINIVVTQVSPQPGLSGYGLKTVSSNPATGYIFLIFAVKVHYCLKRPKQIKNMPGGLY